MYSIISWSLYVFIHNNIYFKIEGRKLTNEIDLKCLLSSNQVIKGTTPKARNRTNNNSLPNIVYYFITFFQQRVEI